jgi:hypothetical protein
MLRRYDISGDVLFQEGQKFPLWIKILTRGIVLFSIIVVLFAGITGPKEQRSDMWIALAIITPVEIMLVVLFQNPVLEKIVTSNGVYFRWKPWQRKFRWIDKESINSYEVRNSPFLHYGIGWFPGYGWMHNASLGEGIQLYLRNRKKFFFSTTDITSFARAIEHLINRGTKTSFA